MSLRRSSRPDVSMTSDEVRAFLSEPRTAVLTTIGRDGFPHSSGMWFVVADDAIRMWTYAKSQKVRNLRRDPRAALLVEAGDDYSNLRGVLVRAEVELLEDGEAIAGIGRGLYDRYTKPRTGMALEEGPETEIVRQAGKRIGLAMSLRRTASWDHRKLSGGR